MRFRPSNVLCRCVAALSLTAILAASASAQSPDLSVRVSVFLLPPFAVMQDGALAGFSVELWNEISVRLGTKSSYRMAPDVEAALDSLRAGNAEVAVSGLFYTSERDKEFDFSYPIVESGLQIMVLNTGDALAPTPLRSMMALWSSRATLGWFGVALLLVLAAAHVVWVLERRQKNGIIPTEKYFPGIFHALYWAATALFAQADQTPRQWLARTLAVLWMFVGISFVAFYTAQLTTTLTLQQIRGTINGPEDLPGKRVATLADSSAVAYLSKRHAIVNEFRQSDDMYRALLARKVDAVLLGAVGQRYYATHEGKGQVKLVGPEFNRNDVGFVFPSDSPLRKKVNSVLLVLREDGTYQRLYDKWFAANE